MTNVKDLRLRIAGISITAKITQTMRMVAAAELIKYKKLLPLTVKRKNLLESYLFSLDSDTLSTLSLLKSRNTTEKKKIKIVLGSDRGLCGGFNSKIVKTLNIPNNQESNEHLNANELLIIVGKKISSRLKCKDSVNFSFANGFLYNFQLASSIVEILLKLSEKYLLECTLVYSSFNNALSCEVIHDSALPLTKNQDFDKPECRTFEQLDLDDHEFAYNLSIAYLTSKIHHALISSKASEESSRVIAMDGATKNSNHLVETLTLQMNKIRQSNITKELIEIVSSSQALY